MVKYPEIDGSWETDPLDLKGFRLDAELEQREKCENCEYGCGSSQCQNCYVGGY